MPSNMHGIYFSIGIHPADITAFSDEKAISYIREQLKNPQIIAIGECGIDHLANIKIEEQTRIFEQMISLSEESCKPLIIHNVRATGEIMQLFKKHQPAQTWIIHGFRGNIQTAQQLQRLGIWLSIGVKYNKHLFSSKSLDINKILLETDGKPGTNIKKIYQQIAQDAGMDEKDFAELIHKNVQEIFCTLP